MMQLSKLVNKNSTLRVLSCKHESMKGFSNEYKEPWEYQDNEPRPFTIVKSYQWQIELSKDNGDYHHLHSRKLYINGKLVSYDMIGEMKDRFFGMRSLIEEALYQSDPDMYYCGERWK